MNKCFPICFPAMICSLALMGGGTALAGSTGKPMTDAAIRPAHATQTLPAGLRSMFYQALATDAGAGHPVNKEGCIRLPTQKLKACFDQQGAHFTGATTLSLHLIAFGRSGEWTPVDAVRPIIHGNQVGYRHGSLREWWRVLPVGFEQGFTIAKRPTGKGELMLALSVSRRDAGAASTRHSRESGNPVRTSPSIPLRDEGGSGTVSTGFRAPLRGPGMTEKTGELGWGKLRYGQLVVTDADGKIVPARLTSKGDRILIAVNDAHAAYPLTVDPLVWLEQKVSANDGMRYDAFGYAVALSGTTALIGAPFHNDDRGEAYVFTESNGIWTQKAKLTARDAATNDLFGFSVALQGTAALIGATQCGENPCSGAGKVYVFTDWGGGWAQTAVLAAEDGQTGDQFGDSIAAEGMTVLIGAPATDVDGHPDQGAAYVFKPLDGLWAQIQMLTALDGAAGHQFGSAVALSGTTALIGAPGHNAAYVFDNSGSDWTQTAVLTVGGGQFGGAVALDGANALVGASATNNSQGAVYAFAKVGSSWAQTARLTASDGAVGDFFGSSVALEGPTALIGAPQCNVAPSPCPGAGKAYVFEEAGVQWAELFKFTASDGAANDFFGDAVALSGNTALIGADCAPYSAQFSECGAGEAYFKDGSDLALTVSAPPTVAQGHSYVSQTIATNNASASSPAVTATMAVPAAASFVSATATQGSCSEAAGVVTCVFGAINGNAGTATANVTFKASGQSDTEIRSTARVSNATPPLTASAATTITSLSSPPSDQPPVADDGTLSVDENSSASGTLQADDPDGDPLTFSIVSQPKHGRVMLADASKDAYTYTPDHDYVGSDSFKFKASDGQLDSNTAKVSITVNRVCKGCDASGGSGGFGWPPLLALLGLAYAAVWAKRRRSRTTIPH